MRKSLWPVLLLLFLLPLPLLADTIYTYTGHNFTTVFAPYTTSMSVSGSFIVAGSPLICLSSCTFSPIAYSFFDGVQILNNGNSAIDPFSQISTDATGAPTLWRLIFTSDTGSITTNSIFGADTGSFGNQGGGGTSFQPLGGWTIQTTQTTVPEPSSLILLGSGLAGFAGVIRRKLIK